MIYIINFNFYFYFPLLLYMNMIPENIINKIKKRILQEKDYSFELNPSKQNDIDLKDNIILYNNGNQWKIIPLIICLSYPIIYEQYAYGDEKYEVSIIVCPITLRSVMFKGRFKFYKYDKYRMILREEDDDDILPIDLNKKINNKFIIQDNKRIEVKIMTLRNAIIYAPDAVFIKCNKKISPIIKIPYYSNDKDINGNVLQSTFVHPKTLVYIASFISQKTKEEKYAILLGNDYNKENPSGYDIIQSKLNTHLIKYSSQIIKKDGYIMPMLWYIAKIIYKKYKIIYLE
jgi:hypothetical protein